MVTKFNPKERLFELQTVTLPNTKVQLTTVNGYGKPVTTPAIAINETVEAIEFIAMVANTVYGFLSGGWVKGIRYAIKLPYKLYKAIDGILWIPAELKDIDENEKQILINKVKDSLEFSDDVEAIVAIAIDIIHKIKLLIGAFK